MPTYRCWFETSGEPDVREHEEDSPAAAAVRFARFATFSDDGALMWVERVSASANPSPLKRHRFRVEREVSYVVTSEPRESAQVTS